MAYQSFRSNGSKFIAKEDKKINNDAWSAYKQGILIDILNPKVALFFMAFLPQFIKERHGSISWQFIYLGLFIILVAIVVEGIYVLLASKITQKLRANKRFGIWLDRVVGMIFVGLGIKLVTSSS